MARVRVCRVAVPMIVPVIVPMISVLVIMVVMPDAIGRLPHTVKLATAGGHGHAAFYCRCRGGGAAGSWASRRFICSNCGESVRSEVICEAGTAASMRSISVIRSCVPG